MQARLLKAIEEVDKILIPEPIDALEWANSAYKPTPTIIEAAQALYRGHNVKEISRSEAGAENLSKTSDYIMNVADEARRRNQKSICFVTGVPGSGKTLAGLNIATQMKSSLQEDAVFLSGNGPLVEVLREALSNDEIQRKNVGAKKDALRSASKFIQNIHHFRDEYVISQKAPVERIVVFDEAQRAWNKEQTSRFMRDKRGRVDFNMSEPEFLLSIMDRHEGWCVVICLIGGGQEINTGEAGLLEWLTALERGYGSWRVYLSDRIGDSNYLGDQGSLQSAIECLAAQSSPFLHLSTCLRSFRAEALSSFIGAIILGESTSASKVYSNLSNYPLVVTRDIEKARDWLRRQARGNERIGLVASSNAMRLKPSGIHVKAKIDPPIWFLADKIDVRSSFALEDVATEFDIQGLELDWVGMCWDANFRRENNSWGCYSFRGSRWEHVKEPIRMAYLANSYRVLLTRARQGMVIYIPNGSNIDHSRNSKFYDPTYKFLRDCGINELS